MRITRTDRMTGEMMVECELIALKQMHRALKDLADGDYSAEMMRGVLNELVAGPLLQNATSIDQQQHSTEEGGR